jgi:hypothetical protein
VIVAIVAGLVAGLAEWTTEAFVRFGGVSERLAYSSVIEGGMSPNWNVGKVFRTVNGPLLCRPCSVGYQPLDESAWLLALPVLAAVALVVALRTRRQLATTVLPLACALSLSGTYLFLINYSAARFLLPAEALLTLPIAVLATRAFTASRSTPWWLRTAVVALAGAVFAGHLVVQDRIEEGHVAAARTVSGQYVALADAIKRLGVRPPCLIAGNTEPIAYDAGCSSSLTEDLRTDSSAASGPGVVQAARHEAVAVLVGPGGGAPKYAPGWHRYQLTGSRLVAGWSAYLPPGR